jgi:hypothetical protein
MGGMSSHELVLLDQAGQALAEARSLDEIKSIRDKAEAVRKYAQSASLGLDVQNRAAEVKLRAERQAGRLLAQMTLRGGDRRSKGHSDRLKLVDLGLTPNQSKRWQLQARVPDNVFRDHVRQTCEEGKELTSAGLIRLAKQLQADSPERNGKSHGKIANAADGYGVHLKSKSSPKCAVPQNDCTSLGDFAETIGELRNHHQTLDEILRRLYDGETASLRPAEVRMVRYLMSEIGNLLGWFATPANGSPKHAVRNDRVAS